MNSLPAARDAERSLLGAVLIDGALLSRVTELLVPEDFAAETNRTIYEACLALADRSEPVDLVLVMHELEKTERLERAGGAAFVSGLVDRVPDVENVASYAGLVRDAARRRRLLLDLRRRTAAVERGGDDEALEKPEPSSPWIDLGRFREELKQITQTRMSTKIPTLDRATEGGISGGQVALLNGPPGSVKSAFAVWQATDRARALGHRAYVYAPDQGGAQPLKRLASTFGNVAGDDDAFARFKVAADVLRVIDERKDGVTIESFRDLVLAAHDDVAAVVLDTPQTASTNENEEERQRIEKCMGIAREIAEKLQVPVYVCSHANRAATAARKKEDRTLERSAGLGGAALEHRAQVVLFLERRDGQDRTEIDVLVTKAPLSGLRFRLLLDIGTWTLREIDVADDSEAREEAVKKERAEKQNVARAERREVIMAAVLGGSQDTGVSFARIGEKVSGRTADLKATLAVMVEENLLEEIEGPKGKRGGPRPTHYRLRRAPASGSLDTPVFQPLPTPGTDEPEGDGHSFPTILSHENETRERVGNNGESFIPSHAPPVGGREGKNERPVHSHPPAGNGKETEDTVGSVLPPDPGPEADAFDGEVPTPPQPTVAAPIAFATMALKGDFSRPSAKPSAAPAKVKSPFDMNAAEWDAAFGDPDDPFSDRRAKP